MANAKARSNRVAATLFDIRLIARHLVKFPPWEPLLSIVGPPSSWNINKHSEFNLSQWGELKLARNSRGDHRLRALENVLQALAAIFTPRVFPFRDAPSSYPYEGGEEDAETLVRYQREKWFFVNGIATDPTLLKMNGAYLYSVFKRPIELIYNPTDGVLIDIFESVFGRTFDFSLTPELYTKRRVEDAIFSNMYDRVILLAHSQGAIVASNVIRELIRDFRQKNRLEKLTRLEVYTFGSAADEIDADDTLSNAHNRLVPYIEHFANTDDVIAQLGILQKENPTYRKIMDGPIFKLEKSGHLFNAHYLCDIVNKRYVSTQVGTQSRLYGYLDGNIPDLYLSIKQSEMV